MLDALAVHILAIWTSLHKIAYHTMLELKVGVQLGVRGGLPSSCL